MAFGGCSTAAFCAEAWDAISRYVYAAIQGGSIMKGWTNDAKNDDHVLQ